MFLRSADLAREQEREAELKVSLLSLSPGDVVAHDKFGQGRVVSTSGSGAWSEAAIDFGNAIGVKHLVLRYAPLRRNKQE
jgi:DNA helicase-2/ATP-dependent DNA helicase PcrA